MIDEDLYLLGLGKKKRRRGGWGKKKCFEHFFDTKN